MCRLIFWFDSRDTFSPHGLIPTNKIFGIAPATTTEQNPDKVQGISCIKQFVILRINSAQHVLELIAHKIIDIVFLHVEPKRQELLCLFGPDPFREEGQKGVPVLQTQDRTDGKSAADREIKMLRPEMRIHRFLIGA